MKRILPYALVIGFIAVLQSSLMASGGSPTPVNKVSFISQKSMQVVLARWESENFLKYNPEKRPVEDKSTSKICACQILNMSSTNYRHENRVLLAEKTNYGDLSAGADKAKSVLESEKKHLLNFFYNKIKASRVIVDGTDCHTLFKRLSSENGDLVLYEILDADAR